MGDIVDLQVEGTASNKWQCNVYKISLLLAAGESLLLDEFYLDSLRNNVYPTLNRKKIEETINRICSFLNIAPSDTTDLCSQLPEKGINILEQTATKLLLQ